MRKTGKVGLEWLRVRKQWVTLNPPDHQGFYLCALCAKPVFWSEMELDHRVSRSRDPSLRADITNLQPTHSYCNQLKGSLAIEAKVSPEEYEFRKLLDL